jgi:membrane-associated phospholipid phosphatase
MTSAAYYLSLSHIVTNFDIFRKTTLGKILRVIIFCLLCILGCLVIISRVILSAHSINQALFGLTLGIGIYFVFIFILSYHVYDPNDFIVHITNWFVITIYMIFHIVLLSLLIIFYFTLDENEKLKYNIYNNIFNGERCKLKKEYLMIKHDGFFQGLAITALIGAHLGIILLIFFLKKNNYVINGNITQFNYSSVKRWLLRLPILLVSGIFILLYFLISGSSALSVIFIFKSAISFLLTTLGMYFVGIFLSIKCNLANENISKLNE